MIGILYLLYTFNYQDFKVKHGVLINVNREWILSYIVILILWYLTTSKSILSSGEKLFCILWILYPLLFPMEEYFIHRVFILALSLTIGYGTDIKKYIKSWKNPNKISFLAPLKTAKKYTLMTLSLANQNLDINNRLKNSNILRFY